MKLRSDVLGLRFDCNEKEKSFKILKKDFIDSWTEVHAMREEKSKLDASNTEKDNWIASLEAELKRVREKHEAQTTKLMQASAEVVVNLSSAQVIIDDLKDEVSHVRGLNENYWILLANCHTLGNRCHNELLKSLLLCRGSF
jgi:predicted RNase H-like nuclease (RuvC/YqgF family)